MVLLLWCGAWLYLVFLLNRHHAFSVDPFPVSTVKKILTVRTREERERVVCNASPFFKNNYVKISSFVHDMDMDTDMDDSGK
jgi:hypothetical protein